uniref:Uncharacterized protein n=1 Tax=Ixodes ricinus TaxID=34613 RepID=A0A6B0V555_IXORI
MWMSGGKRWSVALSSLLADGCEQFAGVCLLARLLGVREALAPSYGTVATGALGVPCLGVEVSCQGPFAPIFLLLQLLLLSAALAVQAPLLALLLFVRYLVVRQGKPVDTRRGLGLAEQVVQQLGWRVLLLALCHLLVASLLLVGRVRPVLYVLGRAGALFLGWCLLSQLVPVPLPHGRPPRCGCRLPFRGSPVLLTHGKPHRQCPGVSPALAGISGLAALPDVAGLSHVACVTYVP